MNISVADIPAERAWTLNAISLKKAVLCADCDVLSDSPHDQCLVCGSRSLFNVARIFGGTLPNQRAKVIDTAPFSSTPPRPVLTFPRPLRLLARTDRGPIKSRRA